jgi:rod shape-determining protein MreD
LRWFLIAILAYVCLVAGTTLFRPGVLALEIDGHWTAPDLILVLGVFLALNMEPHEIFVAGWCFGLGADLVAVAGRLGTWAILFAVLLYAVSHVRKTVLHGRAAAQFLLCFLAVFVAHWVWYLVTQAFEGVPVRVLRTAEFAALEALYSAFLAPYLFWLFSRLRAPLGLPPPAFE